MIARDCLVIGANSYIGSALINELRTQGHRVVGTTRRNPAGGLVTFDLCSPSPLPHAEISFFCAAVTSFRECHIDPEAARDVNVIGPAIAAAHLVEAGGRIVMLSSSAAETRLDATYGQLKLECEREFLSYDTRAAVLRFGPVERPGRSPYADQDYQPLALSDVVRELASLCERWVPGLHRVTRSAMASAT